MPYLTHAHAETWLSRRRAWLRRRHASHLSTVTVEIYSLYSATDDANVCLYLTRSTHWLSSTKLILALFSLGLWGPFSSIAADDVN